MNCLKYMTILTGCSVLLAILSFLWQAFVSLTTFNRLSTLLEALLLIESSFNARSALDKPRVAVGYGACTDMLIDGPMFLNYSDIMSANQDVTGQTIVNIVETKQELLQTFGYYMRNGAAAERIVSNTELFNELIKSAKFNYAKDVAWMIGGNAPLMSMRFLQEGAQVLLAAHMTRNLRKLLPTEMEVVGDYLEMDNIHIILEYKAGERWGPYTAPRANRYILHNDIENSLRNIVERFGEAINEFSPHLLVICGLQMLDSYKYDKNWRESSLINLEQQLSLQPLSMLTHFEMASFVEVKMLKLLQQLVLPHMDSLGMNEQELENLSQLLHYERIVHAAAWNPRIAKTLDHIRSIFRLLNENYFRKDYNELGMRKRLLTRIHVHTLAYQIIFTVKGSKWKHSKLATAKAALTAHRYVCQSEKINPEASSLILDESFTTSIDNQKEDGSKPTGKRIKFNLREGVYCWNETIEFGKSQNNITETQRKIDVEFCIAPVLICRAAKKTAGAGDNISAAALAVQI